MNSLFKCLNISISQYQIQRNSMGNKNSSERSLTLTSGYLSRISKLEKQNLKDIFERNSEGGVISPYMFRTEICGVQCPQSVANTVYYQFASQPFDFKSLVNERSRAQFLFTWEAGIALYPEEIKKAMVYEDLLACYSVMKAGTDVEYAQLGWAMLEIGQYASMVWKRRVGYSDSDYAHVTDSQRKLAAQRGKLPVNNTHSVYKIPVLVQKPDARLQQFHNPDEEETKSTPGFNRYQLLHYGVNFAGVHPREIAEYYKSQKAEMSAIFVQKDFIRQFHFMKRSKLFDWMYTICCGFGDKLFNLDEGAQITIERRLTIHAEKASKEYAKRQGLSAIEIENIKEFFDNEIKGKNAKAVLNLMSRMFKDIKSDRLRKYLITSLSHQDGLTFTFLCNMVVFICKSMEIIDKLSFIFEVFCKQRGVLQKKAIKDIREIFELRPGLLNSANYTKERFIDELEEEEIDFGKYEKAQYMMMAMMAITPDCDEDEKNAILAAMDWNPRLETYIYENLHKEEKFYVIEADFWRQWSESMSFHDDKNNFALKVDYRDQIQNQRLMESKHKHRMRDLKYLQDFVLLPKHVFWPLFKWYNGDLVITKNVIQYKAQDAFGRMMSRSDSVRRSSVQLSNRFHMSSQKFYNKTEDAFEETYERRIGNTVYELEIFPHIVYLSMVNEKGERPHQEAIKNRNIDHQYLSKVLKTEMLPFTELCLSRKTQMMDIVSHAAKLSGKPVKRGRLLFENEIIQGPKLYSTLEEYTGLPPIGALIYAEFSDQSGVWPSERNGTNKEGPKSPVNTVAPNERLITSGLYNMGNTCYMNSAMQVVANLKLIHEYFVEKKLYMKQINADNPLGHKGDLVQSFGLTIRQLYELPNPFFVPRHFKYCLGRVSEQFKGFDQQDSQEYLSWMLDALHEETNLRIKKPYIVNPESDGRDSNELGLETWSNSLRRDWSLIYFMFYGSMRSNLTCKQCRKESMTFDVFSNMPISLPEPKQVSISIIVYRVPNRAKDILTGKIKPDQDGQLITPGNFARQESGFGRQDSDSDVQSVASGRVSMHFGNIQSMHGTGQGRPGGSSQSTRDRKNLAQFAEGYNYMTNDQPIKITLKVDNEIKLKDLAVKIAQLRECNIDSRQIDTEIVFFRAQDHCVGQIIHPECRLKDITFELVELRATEIITAMGKKRIKEFYQANPTWQKSYAEAILVSLLFMPALKPGQKPPQQLRSPLSSEISANLLQLKQQDSMSDESQTSYSQMSGRQNNRGFHCDRYTVQQMGPNKLFGLGPDIDAKYVENIDKVPNEIFVIAYQRRFIKKEHFFMTNIQPQLVATPVIFNSPKHTTGRRLYDEVWTAAHTLVKPDCKYHKMANRWWEQKLWQQQLEQKQPLKPFLLKTVDRTGFNCSVCHWTKRCSGCPLLPLDTSLSLLDLIQSTYLVVEWHSQTLQLLYNQTANEVIEHASNLDKHVLHDEDRGNFCSLDECFRGFFKKEDLENDMGCGTCQTLTPHIKQLSVFKPPAVLTLQLKRFMQIGSHWRKLQTMVDFPLQNLQIDQYLTDSNFLKQTFEMEDIKYDLHGIVCHYGSLGFGHYINFVKNPFDNKWYQYDDTDRTQVDQEKVTQQKHSAYILFYIRKDIQNISVEQLMPNIESEMFPGKPVASAKHGDGFVTGMDKNTAKSGEVQIKFKEVDAAIKLPKKELIPEEDKNEIPQSKQFLAQSYRRERQIVNDEDEDAPDESQYQRGFCPTVFSCSCITFKGKKPPTDESDYDEAPPDQKIGGQVSGSKPASRQMQQRPVPQQRKTEEFHLPQVISPDSQKPKVIQRKPSQTSNQQNLVNDRNVRIEANQSDNDDKLVSDHNFEHKDTPEVLSETGIKQQKHVKKESQRHLMKKNKAQSSMTPQQDRNSQISQLEISDAENNETEPIEIGAGKMSGLNEMKAGMRLSGSIQKEQF